MKSKEKWKHAKEHGFKTQYPRLLVYLVILNQSEGTLPHRSISRETFGRAFFGKAVSSIVIRNYYRLLIVHECITKC